MQKIHFRRVLKLGNKKRELALCYKLQKYKLQTTTDKKKVTCNMCKIILKEGKR